MKLMSSLVVATGLLVGVPAGAGTVLLDFENQTSFSSLNYPESTYGFTANGALQALANDGGGTGLNGEYFSNNPSGNFVMFATEPLPGELAELSSTAGLIDWVSFSYSASAAATVFVRDIGGNVLASFDLLANSTSTDSPFNIWNLATLSFSGVAHSIDFTGAAGVAAFDNVSVNPVPLPAAALLLPFGLAAFGGVVRRRKTAA